MTRKGYGQLSVGGRAGRAVRAHVVAFVLAFGPVPAGLQVCHRCDVRLCVNPAHLFAGTSAENQHDKARKGRAARGESNPAAKLTEAGVRQVRAWLDEGLSFTEVGHRAGVSRVVISHIAHGRYWRHVT